MRILLLLIASAASLYACFVPPAKNTLLFRRDTLPLDSNRQKLLSQDLITLASRSSALQSPTHRRASAQLLALASNFDPQAQSPTHLSENFANLSAIILFLLEETNAPHQREVAQLLLDPLAIIAPELDVVSARPNAEESPKWKRAVAPLSHFLSQPLPEKETLASEEKMEPETEPEEPLKQLTPFNASIRVPLFTAPQQEKTEPPIRPRIERLRFEAKLIENTATIKLPKSKKSEALNSILSGVRQTLSQAHDLEIISRTKGSYTLNQPHLLARSGRVISFPMALLMEGFLSERQPVNNLIVLGTLAPDGAIKAPKASWQFLETLLNNKSSTTQRLLISHELTPLLEAFLTQQKESFFFQYDIFEVRTLEEAYELAFEGAAPDTTATALTKFQEIRKVGTGKTTSVFVANPHVLSRLEEVIPIDPRFLSPTFLQMRGKSQYPAQHSTPVLASLIQSAIIPMAEISSKVGSNPYYSGLSTEALEAMHNQCRAKLDPLGRQVARADNEIYDSAMSIANRLRTLARLRERQEEASSYSESKVSSYNSAYRDIQKEHLTLVTNVARILRQEPPANPESKE